MTMQSLQPVDDGSDLQNAISDGVRHAEDVERATRYLSLIARAAGQLLEATDSSSMIGDLFELIRSELRLDVFFNYGVLDGERLLLEASGGLTPEEAETGRILKIGEAVCGCAARDRRPIHASAIQRSDDPIVAFVKGLGLDAYACTPLTHGRTLIGTLGFGRRWTSHFDEDELSFLHTICHYVALAKLRLKTQRELEEALELKDRLLTELNHRVRNTLQLVIGRVMAEEGEATSSEVRAALAKSREGILLVSAVHRRLYDDPGSDSIDVVALLGELAIENAGKDRVAVSVEGSGSCRIRVEKAVAIALVFDELLRDRLRMQGDDGTVPVEILVEMLAEEGLRVSLSAKGPTAMPAPGGASRALRALLRQLRATLQGRLGQGGTLSLTIPGACPAGAEEGR